MIKIKEKIGYYKTLLTLLWTAFILLCGGIYKVYHSQEFLLFKFAAGGIILLILLIGGLMARTKFWINKLEN